MQTLWIVLALLQLPATVWVVRLRLAVPKNQRAWVAGAVAVAVAARQRVAIERRPAFDRWLTQGG